MRAGSDFAGTVLACSPPAFREGPAPKLCIGDTVVGLATGCLGYQVVADSKTLARIPASVAAGLGATLPTVAITGDAAFRLATLRSGDRCGLLPAYSRVIKPKICNPRL